MPLLLDLRTLPGTRVAVWQIAESPAFFFAHLRLSPAENQVVAALKGLRQVEWLAARFTLDLIIDHHERIETALQPSGKPYLVGRSEEISLSHSDPYVTAMHGERAVGVDIQQCRENILRIEHKFARAEESDRIDRAHAVQHLHLLWGAKECLFKIYGKGVVSFREHLFVDLPERLDINGVLSGTIRKPGEVILCTLHYQIFNNYTLVYGCEIQ